MWNPFKKKESSQEEPRYLQKYREQDFLYFRNSELFEADYVILDCETTGFDKKDQIISIGAVRMREKHIDLNSVLDLKFDVKEGPKHSDIHGELAYTGSPPDEQLYRIFLEYIGNSILVGHHISFDLGMITKSIATFHPGFKLRNKSLDTFFLMKRIDPVRMERKVAGHDSYQLDDLCQEFSISVENRHTALGDSYMTAQLLMKQLVLLKKRGVTRLGKLLD